MDRNEREALKRAVDLAARKRAEGMRCDPEELTIAILQARKDGLPAVAEALTNFRDKVVNTLLGEGWTVERIEDTMWHTRGSW